MKKVIFLILALIINHSLQASECYHYHTSKTYAIVKTDRGIFYQSTEKDPNGISYVQQVKKPLKGIDLASYKAIGEDEATFMFSDKNGFYQLSKNEQYEDKIAIYSKILSANSGQKHINGRLFLIDNKWIYFSGWKDKITKISVNGLPADIENIKSYSSGLYVKSKQQVYAINVDLYEGKATVSVIPNLNPAQVVYYACNPLENEDFIADEKHIYSITRDGSFDDITPQFLALGIKQKFNQLKLLPSLKTIWYNGQVIKIRDGHSVTRINPLTGEEIDVSFSYSTATPLQPKFGEITYIRFRNKIYSLWDDDFSMPYVVKADASQLEAIEGGLFRGKDFYYLEADNWKLMNINIPAEATYFAGRYGYGKYLPRALATKDFIYFIGDRFSANGENKHALKTDVKQIGLFYLFNNALFDGEKSYPVKADYETLVSLGSFVEVINSCAGEMPNTPQVQVKYHQFFKDKDAVYYFNEKTKQLQIIQTASVDDYSADNCEYLQELYKIKDIKGTIKKKPEASLNYYLIGGVVLIVLAVGVFYFKKRK
ncbi:MAG: hypothetical protein EOO96_00370 [Pedobacter sp.]|nr:MAG: hypothetical protein EOO96_00370 [Pedobacter sp.]